MMFHLEVESGSFIAKASNAVSVSARLGVEVEMEARPHVPPSACWIGWILSGAHFSDEVTALYD
jgi:hypothetical protein